jgi:molybdate transport system substrate-binding protein
MMIARIAFLAILVTTSVPTLAAEPVLLHAAGSLRGALTEIAGAFVAATGREVQARFGASGTLKEEIAAGARAEVFASANLEHPQALVDTKKSGPVVLFARNKLCALVRPGLEVLSATLLERMLDPDLKLGTSTPRADPAGDYAWEVFRKADKLRPGSFAALEAKALQLVGSPTSPTAPSARAYYGMLVAQGKADILLTYFTNARDAHLKYPEQQIVALPDELVVGADYGLTVLDGASRQAYQFVVFILSVDGQRILAKHGFAAPALPQ